MSKFLPIVREHFEDARLERVQTQTATATKPALSFPDTSGGIVQVTFNGGDTKDVPHKLGRAFQGWYVVRALNGGASIYEPGAQPNPTQTIRLYSDNAGTFSIRVF